MVSALLWDARPSGETVIAATGSLRNLANDGVALPATALSIGVQAGTVVDGAIIALLATSVIGTNRAHWTLEEE